MRSAHHPASHSDGDQPPAAAAAPLTSIQHFESPDDAADDSDTAGPPGAAQDLDADAEPAGHPPAGGTDAEVMRRAEPDGAWASRVAADVQTTSGVPAVPIGSPVDPPRSPAGEPHPPGRAAGTDPGMAGGPDDLPVAVAMPAGQPEAVPAPAQPGAGRINESGPDVAARPAGRAGFAAAVIALAASALGAAAVTVPPGPVRLLLVLAFFVAGPGAAALCWTRIRDRLVVPALAVTVSMTVACGTAVTMVWTHSWYPRLAFYCLVGAVACAALLRLAVLRRSGTPGPEPADQEPAGRQAAVFAVVEPEAADPGTAPAAPGWRQRCHAAAPVAALVGAVALWVLSLVRFDPTTVGSWGLTAAIGTPFVAAVLLLCVAFAVELFGRARIAVLTAGLGLTAALLHGTVPLLYTNPEYAWTYKHFGVVDLIRDNGQLLDSTDIYQQWPGFFATMAMVSGLAGVDSIAFGAWSSLAFALLNMLVLAALLRQFTSDRRIIVLGVLLFRICMWVDIGYFSPQAFVYILMLGFWLIVTRWLLVAPGATAAGGGRIARGRALLLRGLPAPAPRDRATRMAASLAAITVFTAITVSHQLTPFMMLGPAAILAILGVLRPRTLVVVLALVVIGFAAPRLSSVAEQHSIFSFNVVSNSSGNAATWRSSEQQFSALIARGLTAGVWVMAVLAVWRSRKRFGTVLVPAVITFTPFVTLLAGNYGGEAIYRVFAFSMPFAGLLIAAVWMGGRGRAPEVVTSAVILAVAMIAGLQGLQGQLVVNRLPTADVQAARYFYANARPDSSLVLVAPTFPTRLTGNYGSFNVGRTVDVSLIRDPEFVGRLDGSRLPAVEDYIRRLGTQDNYLVVSTQMTLYADYYGLLPPGATRSLHDALNSSPQWLLFYRGPGVTIYQLLPDG